MTFMLGAFTQGLTQGARDIYGLSNMAAETDATRAHTDALRYETQSRREAADAAKSLVLNQPAPAPTPALNTTPSDTGVTGGGPGTTTNGPVAPLNFDKVVPKPAYMPQTDQASASGFGPNYNPEVGGSAPHVVPDQVASQVPTPTAPTLGSNTVRAQPSTGIGGAPNPMLGGQAVPTQSTQPMQMDQPLMQQLPSHVAMDQPLLQQLFHGGGSAPAAPANPMLGTQTPPPSSAPDGAVHNRPIGTALKDWWNGTHTPDEPMTHGKTKNASTPAKDIGRHLAGALQLGS